MAGWRRRRDPAGCRARGASHRPRTTESTCSGRAEEDHRTAITLQVSVEALFARDSAELLAPEPLLARARVDVFVAKRGGLPWITLLMLTCEKEPRSDTQPVTAGPPGPARITPPCRTR